MAARQPQFSPKQVAAAMQVSESSVKRWCDQGDIPAIRTVGGHRRITLDALRRFVSQAGRELPRPEVLGLPVLPPDRSSRISGGDSADQAAFREALAEGRESDCRRLLRSRIDRGSTRSEAVEFLITDAMHGFGEAWKCNTIDIYQERRGCEISCRLIRELRQDIRDPPASAPLAIGGSPAGDPYQLPTAMVELALRETGWRAVNLGNNLPLSSFLQAAHDHSPQLVWMSISVVEDLDTFVDVQHRFADGLGEHVPLLIGGRALSDTVRPRLRYTAHCDNLRHLVDLAAMMRLNQRIS